jgi:hypothetical protein
VFGYQILVRGDVADASDITSAKLKFPARTAGIPAGRAPVVGVAPPEKSYSARRTSLPLASPENDNHVKEADVSPSAEVQKVPTVSRSASAVTPGAKDQRPKEAVSDIKSLQPKR